MFGKVNAPIVEEEFNAVTVTLKNRNYAEILRLKTRKEKLWSKPQKRKIARLNNLWLGEWTYSPEILFFTAFQKSIL
mgnify:CR=1 FL=1